MCSAYISDTKLFVRTTLHRITSVIAAHDMDVEEYALFWL